MPETSGVFISRWHHGSPAHRYKAYALNWLTSVNNTPTPTLDAFVAAVSRLQHGAFVRLSLVRSHPGPGPNTGSEWVALTLTRTLTLTLTLT